jgi:hypothetical protein
MADVTLAIANPKPGIQTMIDNKTQLPITGVTFTNSAVGANSNSDAADFTFDGTNFVGTGKAAGSGTVVLTAHAAWTDPGDGSAQDQDVTVTKNFTVLPSADGATFDVVFA